WPGSHRRRSCRTDSRSLWHGSPADLCCPIRRRADTMGATIHWWIPGLESRWLRPYGRTMTNLDNAPTTSQRPRTHAQAKIVIEDPKVMVSLLGAADEILKLVERSLASDIMVRG